MSAAIKPWQERIKNGAYTTHAKAGASVVAYAGVAAQIFARDAEIAELRAVLRAPVQAQGVAPNEREKVLAGIQALCVGAHQEYTRCDGSMTQWDSGFFRGQLHIFEFYMDADKDAIDEAKSYLSKLDAASHAALAQSQQSEDARDAALEEAAAICDGQHHTWRWDNSEDSDSGPRSCARGIRALKSSAIAALTGNGA